MLITIAIIALLLVIYAVFLRKWLKTKEWAKWFFDLVEPVERRLFLKSETILMARLEMFTGGLLTFLTQAGTIDITPLMPLVPDNWEPFVKAAWNMLPLSITILGWFHEGLRKDTTKPIEVVALPEAAKTDPVVAEAVAKVDEAVAVAKSTVADATGGVK